jgi:periplasmic divalent cation tolerance protein
MTDKRLYISTAPTREEANTLASELVGRRLAACVNIVGPIASVYRWQGEVENSEEFLLLIKSTEECGTAIQQVLVELHSYKVPELICLPIESGLESYLNWMTANVKKS